MQYNFWLTLCSLLLLTSSLHAQWQQGRLDEEGRLIVKEVPAPPTAVQPRSFFEELPGFPLAFPANQSFKNFRNVTVYDLDDDGVPELFFGAGNQLFAYRDTQLLWQKTLSGTAIYPPSIADLDHDGVPELAQATGGVPAAGRVYVVNALTGEDRSGWPLNFNNNWILTSPTLADVDGNGEREVIFVERLPPAGRVHVRLADGSSFSNDWPVTLDATPAVTASVGDVDGDGAAEIVVHSTASKYVLELDGQPAEGWPIPTAPRQRYSYQSPILADLNGQGGYEIIGATHGSNTDESAPQYYVLYGDGTDYPGWPITVPDSNWTYSPPTVVMIDGEWRIFMSRPIGTEPDDMLYCWDANGNLQPGFPIVKAGGCEGVLTLADVDGDEEVEIIFGSNLLGTDGAGFIHAYELDGSGEVAGFPLRPHGWTIINGAAPTDVNGDQQLDLVALSYTQYFGQAPDTIFIHAYNLGVEYRPELVLWSQYKGSADHQGVVGQLMTPTREPSASAVELTTIVQADGRELTVRLSDPDRLVKQLQLIDAAGRVRQQLAVPYQGGQSQELKLALNHLPAGVYWIVARGGGKVAASLAFTKPR